MFNNEERIYNENEVADILNLSVKTLQQWRHLGKPPVYIKFGRSVRYLSADLKKFVENCKVGPLRSRNSMNP